MATVEKAVEFRELSNAEYHAVLDFDSHSDLNEFRARPLRYYHRRVTKRIPPKKETPDMRQGSALHTASLEPARFAELLEVIPTEVLAKNGAKSGSKYDVWAWNNRNKICLKQSEYDDLRWQIDSIHEHPEASRLLRECSAFEQSVFVSGSHPVKCRFDGAAEVDAHFLDLKRTGVSEPEFWRQVKKFNLHCQAAHYASIFRTAYGSIPIARWIIVLDEPPFETFVRRVPKPALELGQIENEETKRSIQRARASNDWTREGANADRDLYIPDFFYGNE